ncbi:hypothetical protein PDE_07876 [Penicillium oxalicum 114-2]|uniref:Uncharacterized protein n=1 Tax=Penicillium oxalicum (strain 114-2 / CGMCC 5302) TaxID=933388 RepID=S7ZQB6_PENO1|nr:hypothetical protein PDE_07876 [Penicillium oxalicum 114-2]
METELDSSGLDPIEIDLTSAANLLSSSGPSANLPPSRHCYLSAHRPSPVDPGAGHLAHPRFLPLQPRLPSQIRRPVPSRCLLPAPRHSLTRIPTIFHYLKRTPHGPFTLLVAPN